jgi:hypothetical protein
MDGDWLHVLDAPAMGDRVYWYEVLNDDVTYQAQFAHDAGFSSIVLDVDGIFTNYITPDLGLGSYYFRARDIGASGTPGSWSKTGTLEVVEDLEPPTAEILSPVAGQAYSGGDTISIELEVSDDTVLHLAQFTVNGQYAGTLGLKTENYKVSPCFGQPRTVVFDYTPTKGKGGQLEISVLVSDVTYKTVKKTVVIGSGKTSSAKGKGGGKKK